MTDFIRAVALDDIRIRSGGTGRTVEAYAAIFGEPAEIMDADGHYYEVNHPTSPAPRRTAAASRSASRKRCGSTSAAC
jgi:hypothetical protein